MITLIIFRWLAINSYRRRYSGTSPLDDSWLSSMGDKLANSGSLKFSVIYTTVLIVVTLITLRYSIAEWILYNLSWIEPARKHVSVLLALPILIMFLCSGLIYITSTSRGLSWWDAQVISFRFYSFHGRPSYIKSEINSLSEEIDEGVETYRDILTLERLFKHEFKAGQVARECIEQADPKMYHELETSFMEDWTPYRASSLMFVISIILFALSILFLNFRVFISSQLVRYDIWTDMLFTIGLMFFLIWMIVISLELPELTPARYMTLKPPSTKEDKSPR
jgi:hypothetical protein